MSVNRSQSPVMDEALGLQMPTKGVALTEDVGLSTIKKIVGTWSKIFIKQIFFLEHHEAAVSHWSYQVEFSIPLVKKPIPSGTTKCSFTIVDNYLNENPNDLIFNFENESLSHKLDNTMRTNMFESWIFSIIDKKDRVAAELHLGSEFEHTRFEDE